MEIEPVNSAEFCVSTALPTRGIPVEMSEVDKSCSCNTLRTGTTGFCVSTPVAVSECTCVKFTLLTEGALELTVVGVSN